MPSDALAVITDRLVQKYGPAGVAALKTAAFTREQLLASSLDPDRYAFLMATRGDEVDEVLNPTNSAETERAERQQNYIIKLYAMAKAETIHADEMSRWIHKYYSKDVQEFKAAYPHVSSSNWTGLNNNWHYILSDIVTREVPPTYAEIVTSFENNMNPPNGRQPLLKVLCPDGQIRTGKPLKDAIRQWPIELLEPAKAKAAPIQSADDFLNEHPELKDARPPQLLKERYEREFMAFLKSDVGRAWQKRMSEYGHLEKSSHRMWQYVTQHKFELNQKSFELAAVAIADEISVTLDQNDIGGARVSNTFIHDAGGNRVNQLPMGESGMAGQFTPSQYNPDKEWTEAAVRRELRVLNADQLRERLADKAFVEALNHYGL